MLRYHLLLALLALSLAIVSSLPSPTAAEEEDEDDDEGTPPPRADGDDDARVYKNPRNSPSAQCPRDEEQATLLGQKCLRKCSSNEDCKSKKKKCLCDGACGMSCIKPDRECPELEQPENGKVELTGRLFGDKAAYSCPHGYHVVGLQSRSCQADGKWAGQPPACKENIYCLQPPTIEHARHSALPEQETFDLDATVQYNCHTGYVTNGFPRAKCLAIDGQASWYGPDISCEPRSCGEPGDVPHGWVTADCHTYGCRAVVQCGQGFELVGKAERYCQADGAWAPKELPTCVLVTQVQCPPPEAPRHGKAVYTSCAYNSVVSYECKYGYRLVGDATRRCGADKKWSGTQPACKEINCGHPGQLWNGWLENISSGTGLGASLIFRCQDGMRMEGNGSAICQSDGTWSHPLPQCLAPCVVPHVSQGRVVLVEKVPDGGNDTSEPATQIVGSSSMVQHGEVIVVDCEKNYEFPSTNAAVTCNNGTWTQIPRCQPARCKKMPKNPRNGMVIAPKTEHGMKARFRCKDGFELKGNPIVVCSFGNWTGETARCEEVFCPFPGYVENGKVLLVGNMGLYDYRPYVKKVVNNKQIMYECDKGYVLSEGPPGATCVGGHWSPRELPKCTLYQHPRIRWSRRRRSIPEPEVRQRRSAFLRQHYSSLRRPPPPAPALLDQLYDKYNHDDKPTLRHANFKIMKKLDTDDIQNDNIEETDGENLPTAVYTVYNVHGEPIGHRFYSFQPAYEPEEDEIVGHHEDTAEYEETSELSEPPDVTVLKGGLFPEHDLKGDNIENINKLKHEYFERYVDKRRKRFSNTKGSEEKKETDIDLEGDDSSIVETKKISNKHVSLELSENKSRTKKVAVDTTSKPRVKRGINMEEADRILLTAVPMNESESNNEISNEMLKVLPLEHKTTTDNVANSTEHREMAVIPLQYHSTNSTEVGNIFERRDKRTSRKTDRLNQTTATVPKTGRESKGGRSSEYQQAADANEEGQSSETKEVVESASRTDGTNSTERLGKKGRPKSPCEPIESEPYVNIEIVKYGRDPNNTFSSGTIVRVACGKGYGLNLELNATAKCVRGRWKPDKPKCQILPCHVPPTEYGIYTLPPEPGAASLGAPPDERELNETDPVPNGHVVHFSCQYGYNVQGPTNLRCWLREWAVTSMPECVAASCELPLLHGAVYAAGWRAGLVVAHAAAVGVRCEPGRAPSATLTCHLGRLQPNHRDFCRPTTANLSRPRPTSEFQSGSDIVREDVSDLEPDLDRPAAECGPPARVQGTLIYRDGAEVNGTLGMEGYPHGTEITFRCIASIMGEKTTWKLICENGEWVGKSFNCEELEAQNEELLNNNTCTFRNEEPHVVSFFNDLEITETVDFPAGTVIVSRCSDIGKYAFSGSQVRRCVNGLWDGSKPSCFGLNQENDYAMEKPPTILFRHSGGAIAQTNAGRLLVYPGTTLHMECLWMRRFGVPKWNVTHFYPNVERKYPEGWTEDPGRDSALEYRLSVLGAAREDAGVYRCETPARQTHQVEIIVEDVHCPPLPLRRGLVARAVGGADGDTRLGAEVRFHCANGNALLGAPLLVCRPSGNWSAPLPVCESVECGEVIQEGPLGADERRARVAVVSRGVGGRAAFSCAPGWALHGPSETVCLPQAEWARPFPVCKEVSCPALPPPASGYVLGRAPYRAGDVLQFHCNPEHTLHGRPILVCQDSGRWSDKPPTCAQACTYPGTTISGRMSSVKFYYKIGETITFSCEPGHRLKGAPMLRCLKNRKWSNAIPLCTPATNFTAGDSLATLTGDVDAELSDDGVAGVASVAGVAGVADFLRTRAAPAALSPQSYRAAITRVAADKLLRRSPIETYKNRIFRFNRLLGRDNYTKR